MYQWKARERELATFDENRRAVVMLNPMGDKIKGTYRGGEGTTPLTTVCPEDRRGYKTSYDRARK